jgi:hypothetical protein
MPEPAATFLAASSPASTAATAAARPETLQTPPRPRERPRRSGGAAAGRGLHGRPRSADPRRRSCRRCLPRFHPEARCRPRGGQTSSSAAFPGWRTTGRPSRRTGRSRGIAANDHYKPLAVRSSGSPRGPNGDLVRALRIKASRPDWRNDEHGRRRRSRDPYALANSQSPSSIHGSARRSPAGPRQAPRA